MTWISAGLGGERQWQRDTLQQCFESSRVFISVNTEPMDPIMALPYLGHKVSYNNSKWVSF